MTFSEIESVPCDFGEKIENVIKQAVFSRLKISNG